ncbi:ATP-binding protein [Streptomyces sp. NPDC004082]|uniref:ATP-binding protein n=1 Tax=unclassified Streptomyces TaxID=2593676 RepID=UPI0033B2E9E4
MVEAVAGDGGADMVLPGPLPWAGAVYDGASDSIRAARNLAADFMERLQRAYRIALSTRVVGAVQLVVSELVTNVCKHAPGPCALDLVLVGRSLEIRVWDSSFRVPVPDVPDPGRVGRHGLEIVTALCGEIDVRREPVGKRVRVRIALESAPA